VPEVEVALVDPRPLDAGNDLADRVPDDPRVLAVERVPRSEEHGVRAAASASAALIAEWIPNALAA
jgi:hypothetical protein